MKKNTNNHVQLLMYAGAIFLAIASILAVIIAISLISGNRDYYENTISVTGVAELSGEPDIASFSFSVEETAKETNTAQQRVSEKIAAILSAFEKLGLAEADIATASYTIYPKYEWVTTKDQSFIGIDGESYVSSGRGKNIIVGYTVSQSVDIHVRDFDMIPEVLELLSKEAVTNLYGPNFEIEDPEALQDQARNMAIADAKEKAKTLAKELGVKIGKVISFDENDGSYAYGGAYMASSSYLMKDAVMEEAAPELPRGERDIQSTITIIYEIK